MTKRLKTTLRNSSRVVLQNMRSYPQLCYGYHIHYIYIYIYIMVKTHKKLHKRHNKHTQKGGIFPRISNRLHLNPKQSLIPQIKIPEKTIASSNPEELQNINIIDGIIYEISFRHRIDSLCLYDYVNVYKRIPNTPDNVEVRFILLMGINKMMAKLAFNKAIVQFIIKNHDKQNGGGIGGGIMDRIDTLCVIFLMYLWCNNQVGLKQKVYDERKTHLETNITDATLSKIKETDYQIGETFEQMRYEMISNAVFAMTPYGLLHNAATNIMNKQIEQQKKGEDVSDKNKGILSSESYEKYKNSTLEQITMNGNLTQNILYVTRPPNVAEAIWDDSCKEIMDTYDKIWNEIRDVLEENVPHSHGYTNLFTLINKPHCQYDLNSFVCVEFFTPEFKNEFSLPLSSYFRTIKNEVQSMDKTMLEYSEPVNRAVVATGLVASATAGGLAIYHNPSLAATYGLLILGTLKNTTLGAIQYVLEKPGTAVAAAVIIPTATETTNTLLLAASENFYVNTGRRFTDYAKLEKLLKALKPIEYHNKDVFEKFTSITPHTQKTAQRLDEIGFINIVKKLFGTALNYFGTINGVAYHISRSTYIQSKNIIRNLTPMDIDPNSPLSLLLQKLKLEQSIDIQAFICLYFLLRLIYVVFVNKKNKAGKKYADMTPAERTEFHKEVHNWAVDITMRMIERGYSIAEIATVAMYSAAIGSGKKIHNYVKDREAATAATAAAATAATAAAAAATKIQKNIRGNLTRKRGLFTRVSPLSTPGSARKKIEARKVEAAIKIQKNIRGRLSRKKTPAQDSPESMTSTPESTTSSLEVNH